MLRNEGKIYETPISFTSQFYFCPVPLRLDTYSGCRHNCKYCFANNSAMKYINNEGFSGDNTELPVLRAPLRKIQAYFEVAFGNKPNKFTIQDNLAVQCLKRKVPLHFGGMSDPLQPCEANYEVTYNTLKLLKKYDYPTIFSTKGKLLLNPKYYKLMLDMPKLALQISLIDTRQEVLDILEPNASTVQERLQAFKLFKHKWTAVRIQPLIPDLTEAILPDLIKKVANLGCNHVMIEGLKLFSSNKYANKLISNAFQKTTGKSFDLLAYYKSIGAKHSGNDVELPTWRKFSYVKKAKGLIEDLGMTFGCADNDLRFMSTDSINPCCCGINNLKGFENVIKHNTGYACKYAKAKGCDINYSLIAGEWFPKGKFRTSVSSILRVKYGNINKSSFANVPINEMFMEQWNKAGKNSPLQQANVKFKGNGVYELVPFNTFKAKLNKSNFKQVTLGGFK